MVDSGMIRLTLLLVASFSISGCIGFTSHLGTEESTQQFAYYDAGRGGFVKDKGDALKDWGEPISKVQLDASGSEEWSYQGGLAWRGFAIWLVVPIPFVAPVGYNNVKMQFSPTGELTRGTAELAEEKGIVCYLIYLECNPEELL